MKFRFMLCVLLLGMLLQQAANATAYLAWFDGASITDASGSAMLPTPTSPPTLVSGGTIGQCLNMTSAVGISDTVNSTQVLANMQTMGTVSFWIRPNWNGKVASGGSNHILVKVGTPTSSGNGFQIEANNTTGLLRFIMVGKNGTPVKMTVCRADISSWVSGDWHHVQVAWFPKYDEATQTNKPTGMGIWIDRVPVASCLFGGTAFFSRASTDGKIYVGDASSNAYMDELILRDTLAEYTYPDRYNEGGNPIAYRDYFRTAPYTAIQISSTPQLVSSDNRVVAGYNKQFCITATRTVNVTQGTSTTERITNHDGDRVWGEFDARDYINWSTTNSSIASIINTVSGEPFLRNVVHGNAAGTCNINASFRGLNATAYPLTVISVNNPDLDLLFVERTPRYRQFATKNKPAPGDVVTFTANIGNFGYANLATGSTVKYEFMTDTNGNYLPDDSWGTPTTHTLGAINAGVGVGRSSHIQDTMTWTWTNTPTFLRVTLTPPGGTTELCNGNNSRTFLIQGRQVIWGYGRDSQGYGDNDTNFVNDYNNRTMNLVGSFSDYDWCQANVDRLAQLMRDAKYTTTSTTIGITDSAYVDDFLTVDEYFADRDTGLNPDGSLYDGGFEEMWETRMVLSTGNIHEMGHNVFGLFDLYGHDIACWNMLVKNSSGVPYALTPVYPNVSPFGDTWHTVGAWSSATFSFQDPVAIGRTPLMIANDLWLEPHSAGWVQKNAGTRQGGKFFEQNVGTYIPTTNKIQFYDKNDAVLKYAAVYVYQCVNTGYFMLGNKYYPDRQKFFGTTNTSGLFTFPTTTGSYWDDWDTTGVEGAKTCAKPFNRGASGTVLASPPSWQTGEMLLLKVVGLNGEVEFHTLPLTEFNAAYMAGNTSTATYTIRTNLTSNTAAPSQVAPYTTYAGGIRPVSRVRFNGVTYTTKIDEGQPDSDYNNLADIYVDLTGSPVTAGSTLNFDGSVSSDYEGRALVYRWDAPFIAATTSTLAFTAPSGYFEVKYYVSDGTCYGKMITIGLTGQ